MIKNKTIINKIKEKTGADEVMQKFLLDVTNHETESSQYNKKYKELIDRAVGGEEK